MKITNSLIKSRISLISRFLALCCLLLLPIALKATQLSVALDVQGQGLKAADGGVGLQGIGAGTRNLSVNIGGPVQAALLYWAGRDRPCPQSGGVCVIPSQPYKDQILRFDGNLITGTIIGTEGQPVSGGGPINNIGFLADVTSIVQAKGTGMQTFTVADGDTASNLFRLDGAGLIVIYTDPADMNQYRLILYDGLDFAYGDDPTPGDPRVTATVTFNHGSITGARQAALTLFTGDAEAARPDRVDISNNPSLVNTLDSSDGTLWDTDTHTINIPSGVGSTTVQVFSAPPGQNPDSILWEVAMLSVPLAAPQTFVVNTDQDNETNGCNVGLCTLREAITAANSAGGDDIINFDPAFFNTPRTIILTGSELSITDGVTINGPGARNLTVSGNNQFRVFFVNASSETVNISGLSVANGFADANHGGGIRNETGTTLNLTEVTVRNNTASGHGGGIINFGTMNITRSTVNNNISPSNGGGINNQPGAVMNISNSTISDNTAAGSPPPYGNDGGGIINFGQLTLNNVTVSNNMAQTNGGGISNQDPYGAVTSLRNTIIAGNTTTGGAAPDVSGTFNSLGDNLIGNTSGSTGFGAAGDILNQPANLGDLQNNGGPTDTRALLSGSMAIDNGNNCVTDSTCPSNNPPASLNTDQRGTGFPRQFGTNVDIGAFEVQNTPPVAQCRNVTVTLAPGQMTAAADVNDGSFDPDGDTLMFTYNPPGPYPAGQTIVTLTVDDGRGGTDSCMGTVTVLYPFKWFGYSDLLSNPMYFNMATAGSNVPVRFSLGGFQGDPYSQPPTSHPISCTTKTQLGPATVIDRFAPDPYYSPMFDFYQTTWKTSLAWKFTCRRLTLYFKDGTTRTLDFQFK